jgi:hypothetical protein
VTTGQERRRTIYVSYFRNGYRSFEEFQREGLASGESLGREELELLRELEECDDYERPVRRQSRKGWDHFT